MSFKRDLLLSVAAVMMVGLFLFSLSCFGELEKFGEWAWKRHHNILSWYVRPLFLIPFCFFAYKRNLFGMTSTLIALASSMFWFSAPEQDPGPAVKQILELEMQYLSGEWNIIKVSIGLLVPISFACIALAFWLRSFKWGLVVINLMILIKIIWTFIFTPGQGALLHLIPAITGLIVVNIVILHFLKRFKVV